MDDRTRRAGARRCIAAAFTLGISLAGWAASAQEVPRARVTAVNGTFQIDGGLTLAQNATLGPEQRVSTPAGASVDLALPEGVHVALGERSSLVLFAPATPPPRGTPPSHDTTLVRGRAHVSVDAGATRATFATISAVLVFNAGDEADVRVDAGRTTRLSVERGSVRVRSAGREIAVRAGSGARIDVARPPIAVPLPLAPAWLAVPPPRTLSDGAAIELHATIEPARAHGPNVARWHLQLARDEAFRDVAFETTVPASHVTFDAQGIQPGSYFARVRGVDGDGLEGSPTPSARVEIAAPRIVSGGNGHRARVEVPASFYCGLDGAPLAPGGSQFALAPGRGHVLRCATDASGTGAREIAISAAQSGPLVHEVHMDPTGFDSSGGIRVLVLRLNDGAGTPFAYANIRVDASPGASVEPMREGDQRGVYTSTVRWSAGTPGIRLHFVVNDAESFDYTLGAMP